MWVHLPRFASLWTKAEWSLHKLPSIFITRARVNSVRQCLGLGHKSTAVRSLLETIFCKPWTITVVANAYAPLLWMAEMQHTGILAFSRPRWSSGSMLACCARGPRFKSRCGQKFVFSRKSLRYPAFRTGCTLTAVQRSTQPSTLQGTVNAYQPYGWVIIPVAMGECSAYGSLQADSKVKFAAWPTSWRSPGIDRLSSRWTKVNSRIRLALYRHHYKYHPGYYYYYYYYYNSTYASGSRGRQCVGRSCNVCHRAKTNWARLLTANTFRSKNPGWLHASMACNYWLSTGPSCGLSSGCTRTFTGPSPVATSAAEL